MRGFTLIELIVTTAILSLIFSVGIPSFQNSLDDYESRSALLTLRQSLQKARVIALQNKQTIIICPIQSKRCINDWSRPLLIFNDLNNNLILDDDEHQYAQVSNNINFGHWQKKKAKQSYIKFSPLGHAYGSATTFLYCPNSKNALLGKQLVINLQGRIRTNSYLNNKGTPYLNIQPLSCQ